MRARLVIVQRQAPSIRIAKYLDFFVRLLFVMCLHVEYLGVGGCIRKCEKLRELQKMGLACLQLRRSRVRSSHARGAADLHRRLAGVLARRYPTSVGRKHCGAVACSQ